MTEQEYREIFRKDCDEKMKPLVEQVTSLVMKAYEYGLDLGLSTANQIIESKQSDWKDQHPRKGLWDAEKVCKYLENHAGHYITLENDEEGELQSVFYQKGLIEDLRKAMED